MQLKDLKNLLKKIKGDAEEEMNDLAEIKMIEHAIERAQHFETNIKNAKQEK